MEQVATLASPLVVPEPVAAEITRLTGEDAATRWMRSAGKEFVRPPAMETPELSGTQIGDGERAVISWAVAHREFTAVLDDFEARAAAQRLGILVLGTVGVVLRLKQAATIAEVKPLLLKLKSAGAYISDELFREALRRAGERL